MFGYIKIMVGPAQTPDPGKVSFSVVWKGCYML